METLDATSRLSTRALVWLAAGSLALPPPASAREHGMHAGPLPSSEVRARFPEGRSVVEVPFRLELNKILVDVRVGGSDPLTFVLDTGAPTTVVLDPRRLEGIPLEEYGRAHVMGAGGSEGSRTARLVRGASLEVGELRLEGAGLVVMAEGEGRPREHPWDGILGGPLFSHAVVEIDWKGRRLRLHDRSRYAPPSAAVAVPLENRGGHVFVSCEAGIDGTVYPVRLVVDTGASHALALRPDKVKLPRRHLTGATLGHGLNGLIRGSVGRVDELRCAGASLRGVVTSFPDASGGRLTVGADGNLGVEVLRRFVVAIDYGRDRLYLTPTDTLAEPFLFSTSGLQLEPWIAEDGSVGIADVHPGSPAERAGIAVGDRITALDSRAVEALGLDAVRLRLSQAPGTRIRLRVTRAASAREVELELAEVL